MAGSGGDRGVERGRGVRRDFKRKSLRVVVEKRRRGRRNAIKKGRSLSTRRERWRRKYRRR